MMIETPAPANVFCSASEAAALLGVSVPTVHKLIRVGELHAFVPIPGGRKRLLYTYEVGLLARRQREAVHAGATAHILALTAELRENLN